MCVNEKKTPSFSLQYTTDVQKYSTECGRLKNLFLSLNTRFASIMGGVFVRLILGASVRNSAPSLTICNGSFFFELFRFSRRVHLQRDFANFPRQKYNVSRIMQCFLVSKILPYSKYFQMRPHSPLPSASHSGSSSASSNSHNDPLMPIAENWCHTQVDFFLH